MRSPRHTPRQLERAMRFVTALSVGSVGAVRGCGGGTISSCVCPVDGGEQWPNSGSGRACSGIEQDAGCMTRVTGIPSGPLPPPELAC